MIKTIEIKDSKYLIKYDPAKIHDYRIYRKHDRKHENEDISKLKSNIMNDMVFWLIENLEVGSAIEGFTVTER